MIRQEIKADKGVTLIELMIVLVIAGLVVGGIYTIFSTQQRSYYVQDRVTGIQQDARAALLIMAREIRMAGYGIGAGSASGFSDGSSSFGIDGYNYAVNTENYDDQPDRLAINFGSVELGAVQSVTGNVVQVEQSAPSSPPTLFAFTLDPGNVYAGTMSGNDITITSSGFPSGSSKIVGGAACGVGGIIYMISNGVLQRSGEPLAGDGINTFVEDLQFAYQVAGSSDWIYDDPADTWPAGTNFDAIRMVRISLTVRTAVEDPTVADADATARFDQPAVEDHTTGLSTDDGFRRRVYTTVVKIRNLDL